MTGAVIETVPDEHKSRSMGQEAWRMLKKNKIALLGMTFIIILVILAVATVIIDLVTNDKVYYELVVKQNLRNKLKGINFSEIRAIFGFDEFGRSIFYRVIWGIRYSLFTGFLASVFACGIGGMLGAIAGYYGGKVDNYIMRVMDMFLAIPSILMAIAIVSALGSSMTNLLISVSIPAIPRYARVVRASVMSVSDQEFVEAARAVGGNDARIILLYVIPNALAPVIVQFTLGIATVILSIASLSYLGLGIQPPIPEWGAMLSSARNYIRDAWHITVIPGLAITVTILSINLFGDGLRDALDPKLKN